MSHFLSRHRFAVVGIACVLVLAYALNAVDPLRTSSVLQSAWAYAVPLVLAAMVGVIGERSGVVNIGIEGQMLAGGFASFFTAAATGSMLAGVLAGIGVGVLMGAFLAVTTVRWQMDQIIAGVVLNIVATGITSFYFREGRSLPGSLPTIDIPVLSSIPLLGPVFFSGGPFQILTPWIVIALYLLLFHSRWGLRTRAIGEHPHAAETAGINVIGMRLLNVTLAGALGGAAGTYLAMEASTSFERGMTAGRGFLALAIMIFGAWHPLKAMAAALFFGLMSGLSAQLQADNVLNVPEQLVNLLPYVLTLVVLTMFAGRVRPPAASGQPFVKGEA